MKIEQEIGYLEQQQKVLLKEKDRVLKIIKEAGKMKNGRNLDAINNKIF